MNFIKKYRSLNKKLFDNSIAFFSVFFSQVGIQIIFPPLMIAAWGVEYFGVIIYLIAIPAALSFLIMNFQTSSRQEMAKAHLKNNLKKANKIYSNTIVLTFTGYVIFIIGSLIFINISSFDQLSNYQNKESINLILLLIFFSFLLGFFQNILSLKISYMGVYHISKYIDLISDISIKLTMIIAGFFNKSLIELFTIYLILSFFKTFSFYYFNLKIRKISFNIKKIEIYHIKNIFYKSIPYYFVQLEEIFKTSFVIIIIATFFDFKIVAFVTTIRTMFYFFPRKFFELIVEVLQFEYVKLFVQKKYQKLRKLYMSQNVIILVLSLIFIILSYLAGLKIYDIWTKNTFQYENKIFYFLIFDCFFFLMTSSFISFLKSINKFFSISIYLFFSQLILIMMIYLAYNNNYNYDVFFVYSFSMSFLIFCIAIFYFRKSLNYMKRK